MTTECWIADLAKSTLFNQTTWISWLATYGSVALLYLLGKAARRLLRRWTPTHYRTALAVLWGFLSLPIATWMYYHSATDCGRMSVIGLPGTFLFAIFHLPYSYLAPTILPASIHPHLLCGLTWAFLFGSLTWVYNVDAPQRGSPSNEEIEPRIPH